MPVLYARNPGMFIFVSSFWQPEIDGKQRAGTSVIICTVRVARVTRLFGEAGSSPALCAMPAIEYHFKHLPAIGNFTDFYENLTVTGKHTE